MAKELTCDGCGKKEENGAKFVQRGYVSPCDYCPDCVAVFDNYYQERHNLAFESGQIYRDAVQRNRENFLQENPTFKLPDGDLD